MMANDAPRQAVADQAAADALFGHLCDYVQDSMAQAHVPGVALGVHYNGTTRTAGLGVTNLDHPLAVDADTLFQIGSITKTFTSTACLRLVAQGRMALDVPLRRYLPGLRLADEAVAAQVTLRHLLTHTGGWAGDYFDDCGPGDEALARIVDRLAQLPQLTPLGSLWAYNNAGFYLAGRLIEVARGQTYEAAMHALVLEPMGLRRSTYFAAEAITQRVAAGHAAIARGSPDLHVARPWALPRAAHPICGLVASINDLLRYARYHLGHRASGSPAIKDVDPTGRLSPAWDALLTQMHSPQAPAADGELMGLGWFIREIAGVRLLRHSGATNGQAAALWLSPAHAFALVVLTNAAHGGQLHQQAAVWALEHFLGLRQPPSVMLPKVASQPAGYTGRYSAQAADRVVSIEAGSLTLQVFPKGWFPTPNAPADEPLPPVRLAFIGHDQVIALDGPLPGARATFLRDSAGEIVWLRMNGRLHRRETE